MPRFGVYDVFGNGRRRWFFMGRYVTTFNTVDEWVNYSPAGLRRLSAWTEQTVG
jgi:hypothetical protein